MERSLLGKVDEILALTDPGRFQASQTREDLSRDINALTFDLHLEHMGPLLNGTQQHERCKSGAVTASILATRAR